ncbi:MAG: OmpA family protein [Candidatus Kuenenia sp.]|nr:OmpA family protein [Candidatus Kuenenia hertensis]
MSSNKKKKKRFFPAKPPDMFLLSYAALATLLLAFFIIINTFTDDRNKKMLEAFQKSFHRNAITLGMGGLLSGNSIEESKKIHDMKYTFSNEDTENIPVQAGDKEIDRLKNEADHIPAAVVIYFEDNDATLSLEGMHSLNDLVDLVMDRPVLLTIEGHTRVDFKPSKKYDTNWKLSVERAKVVADYLHERGNISVKRLITVGHGNNNSFVKSPGGDRYNDRVSIVINKLR